MHRPSTREDVTGWARTLGMGKVYPPARFAEAESDPGVWARALLGQWLRACGGVVRKRSTLELAETHEVL